MSATPHIAVLGGGFAGLETAFYLRHRLKDRVDITLVSDQDHFVFKPNTIYIPFGADPSKFNVPLAKPTKKKDIRFVQSTVRGIDPQRGTAELSNGVVQADYLVVATGAAMRSEEVPGLEENALTIWTSEKMLRLRERLNGLVEKARGGHRQRMLFLVPPNNRCAGPLYELVMMTDTWLERQGVRETVALQFATYENSFIQAFGPRLNTVVMDEFAERRIDGFNGFVVTHVEPGIAHFQNGEQRAFDLLVSFPPYVAKERFAGLPSDDRGFIHVDPESRRVRGMDAVFAAGDAADFPIKQAFLALLQAGAAADHIAAAVTGTRAELDFEPMSMCVMEELNKATFAQVPLQYTGDPARPIAVDTNDTDDYRVGVSPMWRLGKKVLGLYLPWRFGSGEPFHAGFAWGAMDMGLKVMSRLLAD